MKKVLLTAEPGGAADLPDYYIAGDICDHLHRAETQENLSSGFPTRSDTNRPVQSQKKARNFRFRKKTNFTFCVVTAKLICAIAFT